MPGHPYDGHSGRGRVYGRDDLSARSDRPARPQRSGERDRSAGRARPGERPAGSQRPSSSRGSTRPPATRSGDRQRSSASSDADQATKRPRRRTPVWAILTVVLGALLMVGSGGTLAAASILIDRYTDPIAQENLLGGAAVEPGTELDGPINMLLFGVDEQGDGVRSDTIIVLHVPSTHDAAYLMSVPRDTYVQTAQYTGKINGAFEQGALGDDWRGGAQLVASILHEITGLRFSGAAIINFKGFERIIDALGGIEYCVEDPATSEHLVLVDGEPMKISKARREGIWNYQPIRYEVGCQHLMGWQALDYIRQRKNLESGEGDYGRQRNQQRLLLALAGQAVSRDVVTNFNKLDSLLQAAGDAMIVDTNNVPMIDFLFTMRNLRPDDLVLLRTNGGEYNSIQINGQSAEQLTPESLLMFQAASNDTMAQFTLSHPDFLGE
jgi:LCP family protein required for cell wall assembly